MLQYRQCPNGREPPPPEIVQAQAHFVYIMASLNLECSRCRPWSVNGGEDLRRPPHPRELEDEQVRSRGQAGGQGKKESGGSRIGKSSLHIFT